MVANLNMVSGRGAAMFYAGEAPWHGLGTKVEGALTAEEAIKAAQLDWKVLEEPVFDRKGTELPAFKLLRRSDTGHVFYVPKKTYQPIQNADTFKFLDGLVAAGGAKYVTAGALGDGERVWILAEIKNCDVRILKTDDVVKPYLLAANSHDGTLSFWIMPTPIRVVCQNTFQLALSERLEKGFKILHRAGFEGRIRDAREALGIVVSYYDGLGETLNGLASRQIGVEALKDYYTRLVPDNPEAESHSRTEKIRGTMERLFVEGRGQEIEGVKGSWWAAVNGVTEYVDHERTVRGSDDENRTERRTASILFGSGAALKRRALSLAVELTTA